MNLTEDPQSVVWPVTYYGYVEKIGPFQETAQKAWAELHKNVPAIAENNKISGFLSLYKIDPKRMVYRAGVALSAPPVKLPNGFGYVKFEGGRYSKFTLTGPWELLPQASGRVWERVKELKLRLRGDFAIENYLNEPQTTPSEKLITEILIPTL
jgi:predicted transcriptional regulator YdeE